MIECKLFFNREKRFRPHMHQALSGFMELERQKIISLEIDYKSDIPVPIENAFCAEINNKKVIYDVEDGLNNFFPETIDYLHKEGIILFKRAYDIQAYQNDILIKPYGLNYDKRINSFIERCIFHFVRRGNLSPKVIQPFLSGMDDWSMMNVSCPHTNKILFCTRLWEQKNSSSPVDELNETRIKVVSLLRKEFHKNVIAGIQDSTLSRKLCKDLILPSRVTNRNLFHKLVQQSSVCVTTTGLHNSIGWKFGEYVASGKAVISEPLFFSVPGSFTEGKNYLSFSSVKELIDKCDYLLSNPLKCREIEHDNIDYFFHNLRPDVLIWNTIKQVISFSSK